MLKGKKLLQKITKKRGRKPKSLAISHNKLSPAQIKAKLLSRDCAGIVVLYKKDAQVQQKFAGKLERSLKKALKKQATASVKLEYLTERAERRMTPGIKKQQRKWKRLHQTAQNITQQYKTEHKTAIGHLKQLKLEQQKLNELAQVLAQLGNQSQFVSSVNRGTLALKKKKMHFK
jgi:hypothetical protein